jgi:hypothetical protein
MTKRQCVSVSTPFDNDLIMKLFDNQTVSLHFPNLIITNQ